jgi:hypothetical protein
MLKTRVPSPSSDVLPSSGVEFGVGSFPDASIVMFSKTLLGPAPSIVASMVTDSVMESSPVAIRLPLASLPSVIVAPLRLEANSIKSGPI